VEFFGASVDEMGATLLAHESLGMDEVIVGLRPPTRESLSRLTQSIGS
jgi:hypothetical protein